MNVPYWDDICDTCGTKCVSATRGIPQRRTCEKGHTWIRVHIAPPSPLQIALQTSEKVKDINMKLLRASGCSCTCMTKTPEPEFHKESCTYRLIREAMELVNELGKT